jgi:hypothetical protein
MTSEAPQSGPLLREIEVENEYARYVLQQESDRRSSKTSSDRDKKLIAKTSQWIRTELDERWGQSDEKASEVISHHRPVTLGSAPEESLSDSETARLQHYLELCFKDNVMRQALSTAALYDLAWAQRRNLDLGMKPIIKAIDRIVANLYDVVKVKNLDLYVDQTLIAVFFENEAFTNPSRSSPAPYVVIPRWALCQTWLGCAVAHEIGHNVLRNVQGLYDELIVVVVTRLIAQGRTLLEIRIWRFWLEELFADLFGALQVGPVMARTLLRLLARLPAPLIQGLHATGAETALCSMWECQDADHPMRALRPLLILDAFDLLLTQSPSLEGAQASTEYIRQELAEIGATWDRFITGEYPSQAPAEVSLAPYHQRSMPEGVTLAALRDQARPVLNLILHTPLDSLADTDAPDKPRSVAEVFFHPPNYQAIQSLQQQLMAGADASECDTYTLLAAAEYAFEAYARNEYNDVLAQRLAQLNDQILRAIPRNDNGRATQRDQSLDTSWLASL